jgi:hypothetical protein
MIRKSMARIDLVKINNALAGQGDLRALTIIFSKSILLMKRVSNYEK